MVTIEDFSRIVSRVYGAAVRPQDWVLALADIRRTLDGQAGGLITADGTSRTVTSASLPAEAATSYNGYYRNIDYVLEAVETGPVGLVHDGRALIALKEHSEFDADWMRPYQMDDGLFVRLTAGSTQTSFLVAAPKRSEPFATDERMKFVKALIPHLQQALRTQDHLVDLNSAAADITGVIDTVRHGMVIVDARARVMQVNTAAATILNSNDGLYIRDGRLAALRTSLDAELQCSIGSAVGQQNREFRSGDSLTCTRPSGNRPYVIHVVPLAPDHRCTARALVAIIDPEQSAEPPKALVRRIFGLTSAEADVALRVLRGDGLKPISEELSLSPATVKTHLQHVFDKTETHRQAELVRLLLALVA